MTVESRGPALQDASGKRQEWISLQLQPLKLTDTSTKLRVYICFRRVQIVFHLFGNSNGRHFLNKLRHRDLDRFSIVLLTQFSTTKSKSTLIPGSNSMFSPKPLHSFLKARCPPPTKSSTWTPNTPHFSVVSNGSSEFQEQVTQRNRQRLHSTWLAHRGETSFTGLDICSDKKPACRRARLSL